MSTTALHSADADDSSLTAVIIYDTFDSAVAARQVLDREALSQSTSWTVRPWRVDLLKMRPTSSQAATDSADAHLILIAVHRVQAFLPWLVEWLDLWAECRQIKDAGLALWDLGSPSQTPLERCGEIRRFADRHQLSLLCNEDPRGDAADDTFGARASQALDRREGAELLVGQGAREFSRLTAPGCDGSSR
jgi:hypothetical protein